MWGALLHQILEHTQKFIVIKICYRASLVAQWWRTPLPMQETAVWSLIWKDSTCRGAAKPMCHHYWACALEPGRLNYWSPCTLEPGFATRDTTTVRSLHTTLESRPYSWQLEKSLSSSEDPAQPKISKQIKSFFFFKKTVMYYWCGKRQVGHEGYACKDLT